MPKFDWKKSVMKLVKVGVPVLIAGLAAVYGQHPYYLAIAPLISMVANVLKHKYDMDLKVV